MTCGDGVAEGLGRVLAVQTKKEASDVTVAIPQPEHVPAEKEFDPTISDPNLGEHLGIQESENVPREAVNDTDSRVLPGVETQGLAVCCGRSMQNQSAPMPQQSCGTGQAPMPQQSCGTGQAPEATPALEARPVSTVKEKSMKWHSIAIMGLGIAIMIVGYVGVQMDKQVGSLTAYYLAKEFSPEAMNGRTYVEVTPQVENTGINRFIPIVQQLPYTDAATLERLFAGENWVVAEIWSEGSNAVVQLSNWYTNYGPPWPTTEMAGLDEKRAHRSVLIHPHPVSLKVYADAMSHGYGFIYASNFTEREHYDVASESTRRVVNFASWSPAVSREELMQLGDMRVMDNHLSGVLFLVAPFGTSERFIRLSNEDYDYVRNSPWSRTPCQLKEVSGYWWYEVERSATKEEQTAVK